MNCLLCYKPLDKNETDYHQKCIHNIFGYKQMPAIDINEKELNKYAKEIVGARMAITGVQPKLSLWLEVIKNNLRFTIVDNKSNYIIKPQSEIYEALPENEDLCMHLANEFGIKTATHGLVRLPSGSLAYITKRFDRNGESKLACEDLCQLTETLTEFKYRGSHEKIGKIIKQYSSQSGIDTLRYFELVLFSFISGNADMHLKNFCMLEDEDGKFTLSPAYDLVSTALVIDNEPEQLSLTMNASKNKITKKDFDLFGNSLSLNEKQMINSYVFFNSKLENALWWIANSFLPSPQKSRLKNLVLERIETFKM